MKKEMNFIGMFAVIIMGIVFGKQALLTGDLSCAIVVLACITLMKPIAMGTEEA